jgi:hypothetical protein
MYGQGIDFREKRFVTLEKQDLAGKKSTTSSYFGHHSRAFISDPRLPLDPRQINSYPTPLKGHRRRDFALGTRSDTPR